MNINHAMVAAFERSKQPDKRGFSMQFFAVALMAVFFVALMICLAIGVQVYSFVSGVQESTDREHLQAGFVSNIVHANDVADAVELGKGPEGDSLVLVETLPTGTYETRLYLYQGNVCQEYAIAGRDYNPAGATPLFESSVLSFAKEGRLLKVTTDQGTIDIALRSGKEGSS